MKDEQLRLRLHQEAQRADRLNRAAPGRFVSGEGFDLARHEANTLGIAVFFDGGYADADRAQVCFAPYGEEPVFTRLALRIDWHARFGAPSHSDLLGSLMALGIDRSCFGDLLAAEDGATLFALPEVAQTVCDAWTQAGRISLRVSLCEGEIVLPTVRGTEVKDTVPSLRLDCVLASGFGLSRSAAAELIRSGAVQLDHSEELRVDRVLQAGQLLSVRKKGRLKLLQVGEPTRKARLPILLERFDSK